MKKYHQLTHEERYTLCLPGRQGKSVAEITRMMGRHRSTIYRELKRNRLSSGAYGCKRAIEKTNARRRNSRRNRQFRLEDQYMVKILVQMEWRPDQISKTLKKIGLLNVSHETIYKYIWADRKAGGNLYLHLRQSARKRRKRYGAKDSRGRIAEKRHISERPIEVEDRVEIGHWEGDTVRGTGGKDCIVTLVERTSRYIWIGKVKDKTKEETNRWLQEVILANPKLFKTITVDNGTEFHGYREVEEETSAKFYFATPYSSWERGTNENTNGLIRQYLPKGKTMAEIEQSDCDQIAQRLNTRPRKILGYRTPEEMLVRHLEMDHRYLAGE